MLKYILYARKSTDEEDRQVLSIEAQLAELKEFAAKEKLEIVASFQEAKTAKEPGRTKFGEMLELLEKDKANGILAWHPDRLARNPIDGGRIIYLVDTGKIQALKFPTFWFDTTPQGKFMLNIAFGQSKYYVDNLSENVRRGIRQKLRRGELPGWAPMGYKNERLKKTIVVDQRKAKLIKQMFEFYATGDYGFSDISRKMNELGLRTRTRKPLANGQVQYTLRNPFYYGAILSKGELYRGEHKAVISKELYDQVQEVMHRRGRPHIKRKHLFMFTNFMNCPTCGCVITAERQKGYVYYRCTKKKGPCDQKHYLREEALVEQMRGIIHKVSLSDDVAAKMLIRLRTERHSEAEAMQALTKSLQERIKVLEAELNKLLEIKMEGVITTEEYLAKKETLINERIQAEQKIRDIEHQGTFWLEPMKEFISDAKNAGKIAETGDLGAIRAFLKKIGSNFLLKGGKLGFEAKIGWGAPLNSAPHTNWRATWVRCPTRASIIRVFLAFF